MWRISFWVTLLCCVPYFLYFGFNRTSGIGPFAVLVLGTILAFALMYYVLFRATELPKK